MSNTEKTESPILLIPFMWIGDFVRCQSVLQVLRARYPGRPIDMLSSKLCAPLAKLMPEVRDVIIADFPRGQISLRKRRELGKALKKKNYGSAFLMLGTMKDALAPWFAGIPERIGWVGEARYLFLTDARSGEKQIDNLGERCVALALPKGAPMPDPFPVPTLTVTKAMLDDWHQRSGIPPKGGPLVAMAPSCNDVGRTWPIEKYAAMAKRLTEAGARILVMGGPADDALAAQIKAAAGEQVYDLTGTDLYDAGLQAAASKLLVANDSGLLHVGAATGTTAIAIYGGSAHERTGPKNPDVHPVVPEGQVWKPGDPSRINEISVDQVTDLALRLIAKD